MHAYFLKISMKPIKHNALPAQAGRAFYMKKHYFISFSHCCTNVLDGVITSLPARKAIFHL